jgi:hypothetical protein
MSTLARPKGLVLAWTTARAGAAAPLARLARVGMLGVVLSVPALGQQGMRSAPQPASWPASGHASADAKASDEDALAGPRVLEKSDRSLVHRDFNGALARLDRPAEEAALDLLTLSDEEQAATEKVLTQRAAILDEVVGDNIPLLLKLQGVREEGMTPGRREAMREMFQKLAPLRARGSLREELSACLDIDNAREFERLVEEYWKAVVEDSAARVGEAGEARTRGEVAIREQLSAIGLEIKRSYDRRVADGLARLDDALRLVAATPEQEGRIRNLTTDFFQQNAGKANDAQRLRYLRKVMAELEPSQRTKLLKEWYGGAGPAKRSKPAAEQTPDQTMGEGDERAMDARPAKGAVGSRK